MMMATVVMGVCDFDFASHTYFMTIDLCSLDQSLYVLVCTACEVDQGPTTNDYRDCRSYLTSCASQQVASSIMSLSHATLGLTEERLQAR